MIDLDSVIQSAVSLDPLPDTVTRLAEIISRPDVDLREVVEVVSYDPALTTRIIHSSNSALRGGRVEVSTVKDAVVRLGSGVVLSFAIASSVKGRMTTSIPEYGLGEGALWRHSVSAALAAEILKAFAGNKNIPPEAFTSALLHDIGKLVLGRYLRGDAVRVLQDAIRDGDHSLMLAESEVLGVQHAELGALICKQWKMPESITHGIKFHHSPMEAHEHIFEYEVGGGQPPEVMDTLPAVVHLADHVATLVGEGSTLEAESREIEDGVLDLLQLKASDLESAQEMTSRKLEDLVASYS
ncbi:MAG: HDOD domain-containing protein [Planctomycetota bacterium]